MDEYQINALKDFAKLMNGNAELVIELIEILKRDIQPGGLDQPYDGSLYPSIMTHIYTFNDKPKIYANCNEVNPASDSKQRTPASAIRRHFDSFKITPDGKPRGVKTYVPPYFMWFCSLPKKYEDFETGNRHEIAKNFYNKVLRETQIEIPSSLKIWDENWSPPWIGEKPYPVFHTWEEVRDKIEGRKTPGPRPRPEPDDDYSVIERDFLDPYNPDGIPFFGREKEIRHLNEFAYDDSNFKIWTVIAPSGSGKTRLVFEWTQREAIKDYWKVFYLGQTPKGELVFHDPDHIYRNPHSAHNYFTKVRENGADWQEWVQEEDTIIIIDYVAGFEDVINGLANRFVRRSTKLDKRVRLLVLDHFFPESLGELSKNKRWSSVADLVNRAPVFYRVKPLLLAEPGDQTVVIESIVRDVATRNSSDGGALDVNNEKIIAAMHYLKESEGTWHPLFAALVGDAIRLDRPFKKLNRRKLIEYHLRGNDRIPWEGPESEIGIWTATIICVATLFGGYNPADLFKVPNDTLYTLPNDLLPALNLCEHITSQKIDKEIPPFVPDIIGESFLLLFLDRINTLHTMRIAFFKILSSGNRLQQEVNAVSFLRVMHRLTRNLLNDDQSLDVTKNHWINIHRLLDTDNYEEGSPMKWAASAVLLDIADKLQQSDLLLFANNFTEPSPPEWRLYFDSIRPEDMLPSQYENVDFIHQAGVSAVAFFKELSDSVFRRKSKLTKRDLESLERLLSLYDESVPDTPSLHLCIKYRFVQMAQHLIDSDYDLTRVSHNGRTPLMIACGENRRGIASPVRVQELDTLAHNIISRMDDVDHVDKLNNTALLYACENNCKSAALELIEKSKYVDYQGSGNFDALMIACQTGQKDLVLKLLEKADRLDQHCLDNQTALMKACRNRHEKIAIEVARKMPSTQQIGTAGFTALMLACYYGLEDAALEICAKMQDINQVNDLNYDALMYACEAGLTKVVEVIMAKKPNFFHTLPSGLKAIHLANKRGYIDIVMLLTIEEPALMEFI